jgi:hypothetical protein
MSGIEPAVLAVMAEEAAIIAAAEAAAATAATTAGTAAAGTAATAAGSVAAEEAAMMAMYEAAGAGAGEAAAGGGLLSAEEIAMAEAMSEGAYGGGQAAGGLLSDPSTMLAQDGTGNAFMSDYDKYKNFAQQGFRSVGKGFNSLPKPVQQMAQGQAMQGLLGPQDQGQRQNFVAPPGGGGGGQQHGSANPYGKPQQMPQATPYAPTLVGSENEKEMKRRLMMLRGY